MRWEPRTNPWRTVESSNVSFPSRKREHAEFGRAEALFVWNNSRYPNERGNHWAMVWLLFDEYRTWLCSGFDGQWDFVRFSHHIFECFVHLIEHLRFGRQLSLDIRCTEDRFQVLPSLLTFRPGIECLAEEIQVRVPFVDTGLDGTNMAWTGNGGDVDICIVQQLNDIISTTDNVNIFVILVGKLLGIPLTSTSLPPRTISIWFEECRRSTDEHYACENAFQTRFWTSLTRDFLNSFFMLKRIDVDQFA